MDESEIEIERGVNANKIPSDIFTHILESIDLPKDISNTLLATQNALFSEYSIIRNAVRLIYGGDITKKIDCDEESLIEETVKRIGKHAGADVSKGKEKDIPTAVSNYTEPLYDVVGRTFHI